MAITPLSSATGFGLFGGDQLKKTAPSGSAGSADFASVLSDLAKQTASNLRTGEETAIKGIQGQASVQEVVQSVMQAETSLQAAIGIRDKVVSAYQDLTRMTI